MAVCTHKWGRFLAAFAYYLLGSYNITETVASYYGGPSWWLGVLAWVIASVTLAFPWAFANGFWRSIIVLLFTTIPPLGCIGWLSPLTAAGVLYPSSNLWGVGLITVLFCALINIRLSHVHAKAVLGLGLWAVAMNLWMATSSKIELPKGWATIQTSFKPAGQNLFTKIKNQDLIIEAGLTQGAGSRVLVFPEAILDNWGIGTQMQFSQAIPTGQTWLLGAEINGRNSVIAATANTTTMAVAQPLTTSAALLLGGNWRPWTAQSLRPNWWQKTFEIEGQRVWAALCVEQLLPWTWIEALWQSPTLIIAQSNQWWSTTGSAVPSIQKSSTLAFGRLIGIPIIFSQNLKK
ncbi:MAG: hypothetical protein RLY95_1559 [Pseudomonadota bacterium]